MIQKVKYKSRQITLSRLLPRHSALANAAALANYPLILFRSLNTKISSFPPVEISSKLYSCSVRTSSTSWLMLTSIGTCDIDRRFEESVKEELWDSRYVDLRWTFRPMRTIIKAGARDYRDQMLYQYVLVVKLLNRLTLICPIGYAITSSASIFKTNNIIHAIVVKV